MKKIVILSLLFCFSISSYAQDDVMIGVHLNPFISWMSTNNKAIESAGVNPGFKLGMSGEFYGGKKSDDLSIYAFTVGLGISFNQGGTLNYTQGGDLFQRSALIDSSYISATGTSLVPDSSTVKHRLQYVEIPVGIKLRTNEFGYLRYYMEVPFTLGIRTQSRSDIDGQFLDISEKENTTPDMSILNLSWGIGAGVEYDISGTGTTALFAGLYFQSGFLDVTRNDKDDKGANIVENAKATINKVNLRVGVFF